MDIYELVDELITCLRPRILEGRFSESQEKGFLILPIELPFLDIGEETSCSGPSGCHLVVVKENQAENEAATGKAKRSKKTLGSQWHSLPIELSYP